MYMLTKAALDYRAYLFDYYIRALKHRLASTNQFHRKRRCNWRRYLSLLLYIASCAYLL